MKQTAILFAFLSAVLMGTIGVFSKLTGLSAEMITFFRLFIGSAFMFLFLAATRNLSLLSRWPSLPVLVNGCLLAGFIIFYVQAMNYTSMANAIMLVYLAPVAASIAAHFFLGERLSGLTVVLIAIALFGFAMMMEFNIEISHQSSAFTGICFGFLAMFAYGGFILVNRLIKASIHVYTRTFYQLLVGALIMVPFIYTSIGSLEIKTIPWLLAIGFFPGFLAILFAVIALSRLSAATFGTIAYTEPVAVVLFGWTLFHESLSPLQIGGCILIIFSGVIRTITAQESPISET